MKEMFIDSAGVRLHSVDWGGEGRTILLFPGLGDTARIYDGLAARLSDSYRVLGLTRRGHGRSERPAGGYDLDTLTDDMRRFMDTWQIERAVLAGHSFAGLELPRFAVRYPDRVEGIIFLDALFPPLDPEPDLSSDPVWAVPPNAGPMEADLRSKEAYVAFIKYDWPSLAAIWNTAVEANFMEKAAVQEDGTLRYTHDDALMNAIIENVWLTRDPEYRQVAAPMLAVVPDGDFHQAVPTDADDDLRRAADAFWLETLRPWLRQRTAVFRQTSPSAQIVELDSPFHHIFIAEEEAVAAAIIDFLEAG
jgi:pimeloyl-ACP methyl ester carboxylesterase